MKGFSFYYKGLGKSRQKSWKKIQTVERRKEKRNKGVSAEGASKLDYFFWPFFTLNRRKFCIISRTLLLFFYVSFSIP